jgi:hypothetical protein
MCVEVLKCKDKLEFGGPAYKVGGLVADDCE